jgi:HSP20 family protein
MLFGSLGSLDQMFREMRRAQRDLDRVWDQITRGRGTLSTYPALNIREDGEYFFVEAELPGYKQEDLQVYIVGQDQLVIKGERQPVQMEKAVCHRQERAFGKFSRTLTLPAAVDADKVEAKLEFGILRLKLAKSPSAKAKRITVKA